MRDAPEFAAILNPTEPLPAPGPPDVMVIHPALLEAVHGHVLPVVTATVAGPPGAATSRPFPESEYEHPAWFTVNALPAMVSDPVRDVLEFAATLNPTDPLPTAVPPDVMVIHPVLLVAVHAHVLEVVTAIVAGPPADATSRPFPASENEQAACDTVIARPATVSDPVRDAPAFTATLNATVPLPTPVAPDVRVIHATLLDAAH